MSRSKEELEKDMSRLLEELHVVCRQYVEDGHRKVVSFRCEVRKGKMRAMGKKLNLVQVPIAAGDKLVDRHVLEILTDDND